VKRTLFFLLLLLLSCRRGISASCSTTGGWGSGGTASRADVQEQVLDILALESLGEELAPDRLDVGDFGSIDEGFELVGLGVANVLVSLRLIKVWSVYAYSDFDTVIGEDEGGVGGSKFWSGHFDVLVW
jgi:hypothetical protein